MSTRAFIGIEKEDKSIEYVYSHWNNYPESNGKILLENYNTKEKVEELLSYGDVSVLGQEIGEKHNFDNHSRILEAKNWCLFYGRDRGEDGIGKKKTEDEKQFLTHCTESYTYLFKNGQWFFRRYKDALQLLTKEDCE